MERKKQRYVKSIFDCLNKSREYEKQYLSPKNIIRTLESETNDFEKIEELTNYLRNSVSKPKMNIDKIITELESYIEAGNNSNTINKLFYCSKLFIDCIDLLELSQSEYIEKIFDTHTRFIGKKLVSLQIFCKSMICGRWKKISPRREKSRGRGDRNGK